MKRFVFLLFIGFSLTVAAEQITMDLTTATDMAGNPITYSAEYGLGYYDGTDVWDSTYNDSGLCQFIYVNEARFMLSHMPSQNSYWWSSWEGFTLSRVSQDTANVFGCVANGGLSGEATPYVIAYFSDWVTESQGYSSNLILFDEAYYPEYVYICQNSNTMKAITEGGVFNARAFTEEDTLALVISAIDDTFQETKSITYYLAVDGEMNNGWVKVPLTDLGQTEGLSFRMTTTDMGQFGMNTPMYFALDALTVNTESIANSLYPIPNSPLSELNCQKLIRDGQLLLLRDGVCYTMMGGIVN